MQFNKTAYGRVKTWVLASAEKMSAEDYSFKPVSTVRSYGQMLGHIADAQYLFCSAALGEQNPSPNVEKTKTSKADLVPALKEAFGYCDKAYDSITDASASQTAKFFGREIPKTDLLTSNVMHTTEHYGNLVTYLRMKGQVPPSSERPPAKKK